MLQLPARTVTNLANLPTRSRCRPDKQRFRIFQPQRSRWGKLRHLGLEVSLRYVFSPSAHFHKKDYKETKPASPTSCTHHPCNPLEQLLRMASAELAALRMPLHLSSFSFLYCGFSAAGRHSN
jgi:hypothetical protein